MYEVVWSRELKLILGSSMEAITLILIIFMGGLALGSYFFGRLADRIANPLKVFIILECGIGLYGVISGFLFSPLNTFYLFLIRNSLNPALLFMGRFGASILILIIPTILMGGTLPVIAKVWVKATAKIGAGVSFLYGINTLGAVAGAYAAGFVLLPMFGMRNSLAIAGVNNLIVAWMMLLLLVAAKLTPPKQSAKGKENRYQAKIPAPEPEPENKKRAPYGIIIVGIGVTGFAAMALEVAWTRIIILTLGSSVYGFSSILICYLTGIALGSLFVSRYFARIKFPLYLFGVLQISIFLMVILTTPILGNLPLVFLKLVGTSYQNFTYKVSINFLITLMIMFGPTFLMGIVFPLAIRILTPKVGSLGLRIGQVYGINTLGTLLGAGLAGFLFIPWFGTRNTIFMAGLLNLILGITVLFRMQHKKRRRALVLIPLGIVLMAGMSDWSHKLMILGPFNYADRLERRIRQKSLGDYLNKLNIVYFREGLDATVAITEDSGGARYLRINGKVDASTDSADMNTQVMLGHLPLFLKPDAKEVLVIGMGSGVTSGAALKHPIESLECIEISKAVLEGSRRWFSEFNGNIFEDRRFRTVSMDARHYLNITPKQYDVIISEPSNPWITGVSNLFTRESFQQIKNQLVPGGIACQWIHYYSMDSDDLKMIMRTFADVFPYSSAWSFIAGDMMLIGSTQPYAIDYDRLQTTLANDRINRSLARVKMNSGIKLIAGFVMDKEQIHQFSRNAAINTDDRPLLEFSAPKALLKRTSLSNILKISHKFPIAYPPVSNLKLQTPDGVIHKHLNLVLNLPDEWVEQWSGFWSGRIIKIEKDEQGHNILKNIVWTAGRRINIKARDQFLIVEGVRKMAADLNDLKSSIVKKYQGKILYHGKITINQHPGYWVYARGTKKYSLGWTWFCPLTRMRYTSKLQMKTAPDQIVEKLRDFRKAVVCYHAEKL